MSDLSATKYGKKTSLPREVKKIVWEGRAVDLASGPAWGTVGRTHDGGFKAGEDTLYAEPGYSKESVAWGSKRFEHKEHAICDAQNKVVRAVAEDRADAESDGRNQNASDKFCGREARVHSPEEAKRSL